MWRQLIIPLLRRRQMSWLLREQLNHLLVMLVSIPVCLLFLSILMASSTYLTLSSLIIFCIYLLLRCILSDISCSLFNMVIMHSPLISRMLIYIFLFLCIIVIFSDLFGTICYISGRLYLLGLPQLIGFSQSLLNLSCSFAITGVSILLSIWMTPWSWFTLSRQVRGHAHFCVPYWFALDCILIFPSHTFSSVRLLWFFRVILGYCPCVSIFASW